MEPIAAMLDRTSINYDIVKDNTHIAIVLKLPDKAERTFSFRKGKGKTKDKRTTALLLYNFLDGYRYGLAEGRKERREDE